MAVESTRVDTIAADFRDAPSEGLGSKAWHRFRRNRAAMVGTFLLIVLIFMALAAPILTPHDPHYANIRAREQPPGAEHRLGTDGIGRDVMSRILWGGRMSLMVGVVSMAIALTLGILFGALAGYYGGWIDNIIMRFVDIILSFPTLVLLIVVASMLPAEIPSIYGTMTVIGGLSWPGVARLVRAEFLSIREREYVEAARAAGINTSRTIFRHMLPGAMAPIVVAATLGVAGAILSEASLSFLGLGVQPPIPSWGNMLSEGLSWRVLSGKWWLWIPPGVMIFISVMSINLVGDGLRDALDPRQIMR